jgi:hypothetical protein
VTRTGTPPTDPHEDDRADELLAGYVLRTLTGDDAAEADRLLSEHVPGCAGCRATLLAFSDTVADLALGADTMAPPETLLPRLHRELGPRTARPAAGRSLGIAAGVALVLIAGGLAVSFGFRVGDLQERNDLFQAALRLSQRPGADMSQLVGTEASDPAPVSTVSAPNVAYFFLVGTEVPAPPAGSVYGVWLTDGEDATFAGTFLPTPGVTVVQVSADRSRFDRVLVTVEPEGTIPAQPGHVRWEAAATGRSLGLAGLVLRGAAA